MHGHGTINWWGFSPSFDIASYILACRREKLTKYFEGHEGNYFNNSCMPSTSNRDKRAFTPEEKGYCDDDLNILVIGAGDPRLILESIAGSSLENSLTIYVLESRLELYGRLLLLLHIILQPGLIDSRKVDVLLDIWCNLNILSTSKDVMDKATRSLARDVTDDGINYQLLNGLASVALLKHRERDGIDDYLVQCSSLATEDYDPSRACIKTLHMFEKSRRELRLRRHFGPRYDYRDAEADWSWYMRLEPRIKNKTFFISCLNNSKQRSSGDMQTGNNCTHCWKNSTKINENGDCSAKPIQDESFVKESTEYQACGGWGKEFLEWRRTGNALDISIIGVSSACTVPNTSLVSRTVLTERGCKELKKGYWGTVLCSPHPTLSLACSNTDMSLRTNGKSVKSGTDVARWNMACLVGRLMKRVQKDEFNLSGSGSDVDMLKLTDSKNILKESSKSLQGLNIGEDNNIIGKSHDMQEKQELTESEDSESPDINFKEEKQLDGNSKLKSVKIVLISPDRMKKLSFLPEIHGKLDGIYLSAATVHLLNTSLAKNHLHSRTTLVVEDAMMFPDLKDGQVEDYRSRVQLAAEGAGWTPLQYHPEPVLHHCFTRKHL